MSNRPPIPEAMKRKVRQEAYFGCVKCGCPIIEYHHIEPWSKVKKHEAKNLVALCPNCHREATVGAYYEERVIEDKKNPINKKTGLVQNQIMLRKFDDIVVKLGGAEISKTQNILFLESRCYVKAIRRLPQASSLSCLHGFIIIFIDGAICIIVLKLRIVSIVLVIVHIISIWSLCPCPYSA